MAVDINWGILQPVDVGGAFTQGMEQGRQRRVEQETRSALSAYATNPDDPNVFTQLAKYNPGIAIQIRQQQSQRQAAQQEEGRKVIGQAALRIASLPPEQQAAAWDSTIGDLSTNYPGVAQYKGQYSPERLQSVLAQAGLSQQAIENARPKITPTQAGGSYVVQNQAGQMLDPSTNSWISIGQPGGAPPAAPQPAAPAQPLGQDQGAQILRGAQQSGIITPEDAQAMQASLGQQGQGRFQQWMQQHNVRVGKQVNGQTFYMVNGKWYDNPEGR